MKKFIITFVGALLMTPEINAQTEKFLVITADGVNLRKAPSAQAAKLMVDYEIESEGPEQELYYAWATDPKRRGFRREPFAGFKGMLVNFIKQVGDWVQCKMENGDKEVWVSAKFTAEAKHMPLGPDYISNKYKNVWELKGIPVQKVTIIDNSIDWGDTQYSLAVVKDGALCITERFTPQYGKGKKGLSFTKTDYMGWVLFIGEDMDDVSVAEVFDKLTAAQVNEMYNKLNPDGKTFSKKRVYLKMPFTTEWNSDGITYQDIYLDR